MPCICASSDMRPKYYEQISKKVTFNSKFTIYLLHIPQIVVQYIKSV